MMNKDAMQCGRSRFAANVDVIVSVLEFVESAASLFAAAAVCRAFRVAAARLAHERFEEIIDCWSPVASRARLNARPVPLDPVAHGLVLPVTAAACTVFAGGSHEADRVLRLCRGVTPPHTAAMLRRALGDRAVAIWPSGMAAECILSWTGQGTLTATADADDAGEARNTSAEGDGGGNAVAVAPLDDEWVSRCAPRSIQSYLRALGGLVLIKCVDTAARAGPVTESRFAAALAEASVTPLSDADDGVWNASESRTVLLSAARIQAEWGITRDVPPDLICTEITASHPAMIVLMRHVRTAPVNVAFAEGPDDWASELGGALESMEWKGNMDLRGAVHCTRVAGFTRCGFTTMDLPSRLTEIGAGGLRGLPRLQVLDLSKLPLLHSIHDGALTDCGALWRIVVPRSVESIGRDVFSRSALVELDLSHCTSLRRISAATAAQCDALRRVRLPPTVEWIGEYCFSFLPRLTDIDFGGDDSRLTVLSPGVLRGCNALTCVAFPPLLETFGTVCVDCTSLVLLDLSRCIGLRSVAPRQVDRRRRLNHRQVEVRLPPNASPAVKFAFRSK